jgi:cytochrome c5
MGIKPFCRVSFFTLAIVLTISAAIAADRLTGFKSVNVDLPFGDRVFEGPGADVVNNNCLACHSVGMVLTQPPLSRQTWEAEVAKMRNVYKAPIANEDVTPIVDYLSKLQK